MPKNDIDSTARSLRQVRSIGAQFQTRAAKDGEGPVIDGYFSVFNSDYPLWPGATEQVALGAFAKSLAGDYGECDARARQPMYTTLVLGRTTAGTRSRCGLRTAFGTIQINEQDTDAMNLYARVQRGDVSQCSFGFDIKSEEFVENPDGSVRWIIKDVVLYEVSVCTFPAYAETSVEARKNDPDTIRRREGELWKTKMKERINKCRSREPSCWLSRSATRRQSWKLCVREMRGFRRAKPILPRPLSPPRPTRSAAPWRNP